MINKEDIVVQAAAEKFKNKIFFVLFIAFVGILLEMLEIIPNLDVTTITLVIYIVGFAIIMMSYEQFKAEVVEHKKNKIKQLEKEREFREGEVIKEAEKIFNTKDIIILNESKSKNNIILYDVVIEDKLYKVLYQGKNIIFYD